jgi:hypothetical protein
MNSRMKSGQYYFLLFSIIILILPVLTGCNTIGMLLFYRGSKTATVYRSSDSKKDYYIVKATTLSHCGCTELYINNFKNGSIEFNLYYTENLARKTIFRKNTETKEIDTIRLLATPYSNYTIPFNSLDTEMFNRIDSIAIQKPKGIIYQIKRNVYKGYISDPYSGH